MALDAFRDTTVRLDFANDEPAALRLSAGDIDGRTLTVVVTDGGAAVTDDTLTAELQWNTQPDDPDSAGGMVDMTRIEKKVDAVLTTTAFTTPIPRALLLSGSPTANLAVAIRQGDTIICSRAITAIIEPSLLKTSAPDIADPLAALHNAQQTATQAAADAKTAVDTAQRLIDAASITSGDTTTLNPNEPATSALTGDGLTKTLALGIPRGASIAGVTVTTGDPGSDATATLGPDTDTGDKTLTLTIPRGDKGDKGDTGERGETGPRGDAGDVATTDSAGVVKPGAGLAVESDGTLSVDASALPVASKGSRGVIRVGTGLSVTDGDVSIPNQGAGVTTQNGAWVGLTTNGSTNANAASLGVALSDGLASFDHRFLRLTPATSTTIGGVKPGSGLAVTSDGTLTAGVTVTAVTGDIIDSASVLSLAHFATAAAITSGVPLFLLVGASQQSYADGTTVTVQLAGEPVTEDMLQGATVHLLPQATGLVTPTTGSTVSIDGSTLAITIGGSVDITKGHLLGVLLRKE